jgi:glutamate racemase
VCSSDLVLGCTHYPFIKPSLRRIFGENTLIVDGSEGTARHLKDVLEEKGLLHKGEEEGSVRIFNSSDDIRLIELSQSLLEEDSDQN